MASPKGPGPVSYSRVPWWIAGGILIAILLLTTAILNYRLVSGLIATQQTRHDLSQETVVLEQRIRQLAHEDPRLMSAVIAHAKTDNMAWIEFRDGKDRVIIHRGLQLPPVLTPAQQRDALRQRRPAFRVRDTPMGRVVEESFGVLIPPTDTDPTPQYGVLEMAMVIDAPSAASIWPVLRNLLIEAAAAVTLLAALVLIALRFRSYAKGQYLEQQVAIARQVQMDLMPASGVTATGFDVAAECDPAAEISGDFYDIFPVPTSASVPAGNQLPDAAAKLLGTGFVLGDVSGKGLPASLLMGVLHGAVRSCLWTHTTQAHTEATRRINRLLYEHAAKERYASMFWGYYEPGESEQTGVLRYVNAGHPPPLLIRDGMATRLETGGPVLGALANPAYEQGSVSFGEGDVLVLYSDGISEAASPNGEEFGIDRLAALAVREQGAPSDILRGRILEAVREFTAGAVTDDRTLLIIRREAIANPPSEPAVAAAVAGMGR